MTDKEKEIMERYRFLARTIGLLPGNHGDGNSIDFADNIIPFPKIKENSSDLPRSGNKTGINKEKE